MTLITVTGQYRNPDGSPATGYLRFTPSEVLVDSTAGVPSTAIAVKTVGLSASGSFSIGLESTNNPTLLHQGSTYLVEEFISTGTRSYHVSVPYNHTLSPVELKSLQPVTPDIPLGTFADKRDLADGLLDQVVFGGYDGSAASVSMVPTATGSVTTYTLGSGLTLTVTENLNPDGSVTTEYSAPIGRTGVLIVNPDGSTSEVIS